MATDKKRIKSQYPLPAYNYRITIDATVVSFAEVSGFSIGHETVTYEYREFLACQSK